MQKSKIKICVNTVAKSEAQELAKFADDNWHNQYSQLFNNYINIDNELILVNLAEFELPGKISFANTVRGICKK